MKAKNILKAVACFMALSLLLLAAGCGESNDPSEKWIALVVQRKTEVQKIAVTNTMQVSMPGSSNANFTRSTEDKELITNVLDLFANVDLEFERTDEKKADFHPYGIQISFEGKEGPVGLRILVEQNGTVYLYDNDAVYVYKGSKPVNYDRVAQVYSIIAMSGAKPEK